MKKQLRGTSRYDDILYMPHPDSKVHPRMSMIDRAAQFSPFAALTGYEAAIDETGRRTDARIELDESQKEELDHRMQMLQEHLAERPEISVTYFVPDERKEGGAYVTVTGRVRKVNLYERVLILEEEQVIPIAEMIAMSGEMFEGRQLV